MTERRFEHKPHRSGKTEEQRRKQAERIQRRMLADLANAVDLDDVKAVVAELIKRTIR